MYSEDRLKEIFHGNALFWYVFKFHIIIIVPINGTDHFELIESQLMEIVDAAFESSSLHTKNETRSIKSIANTERITDRLVNTAVHLNTLHCIRIHSSYMFSVHSMPRPSFKMPNILTYAYIVKDRQI